MQCNYLKYNYLIFRTPLHVFLRSCLTLFLCTSKDWQKRTQEMFHSQLLKTDLKLAKVILLFKYPKRRRYNLTNFIY